MSVCLDYCNTIARKLSTLCSEQTIEFNPLASCARLVRTTHGCQPPRCYDSC